MDIAFDNSFYSAMEGFYAPAEAAVPSAPQLLIFNHALADILGLDVAGASNSDLARLFSGQALPGGANPVALAYAGHQFGHFSSQLGDGRALLLGEIVAPGGARFDVQLKGSGPTPFSRNGDGKAAIGPVMREYLISEAMAALGVPTTRSLAAVATGDRVQRERAHPGAVLTRIASGHIRVGILGVPTTRSLAAVATGDARLGERAHPGAVLTRIASSHIRVGTFQFFAAHFSSSM